MTLVTRVKNVELAAAFLIAVRMMSLAWVPDSPATIDSTLFHTVLEDGSCSEALWHRVETAAAELGVPLTNGTESEDIAAQSRLDIPHIWDRRSCG